MVILKRIKALLLLGLFMLSICLSGCSNNEINKKNTVTLYASTGGTVEGSGKFNYDESITATAIANNGYEFENWRGYKSGKIVSYDTIYTFQTENDTSLIANFKETIGEIVIISESDNINIPTIPNYGDDVIKDRFQIMTRYIGDLFINDSISQDKSGVINKNGKTEMVINTHDLEARGLYEPITGGGPHIWMAKRPSEEIKFNPWAKNNELVLQMNAAVPFVELTDKDGNKGSSGFTATQAPVTQLSFAFYLLDESSKKTFAYVIPVYESRGTYQESANNSDTFVSFISSPLERRSSYITMSLESEHLQSKPFSDKRFFQVSLTKDNLLKGINDTNADMSTDLSNYQVTFIGVLFELPNYVEDGHNISMVNISGFKAYIK